MKSLPRWLAWLALPAALAACDKPRPPADLSLTDAFLSPLPVAQKEWQGILLELGSPAARPHLGVGWSIGETAHDGRAFRWAMGDETTFLFESESAGERLAWIECEPFSFPGAPVQVVDLSANGRSLPSVELREGRNRYPLEIPLIEGVNEIRMKFAYAKAPGDVDNTSVDRRRLAAAIYRFDVLPVDAAPVAGRPGPFALVSARDGSRGIYLPEGGVLSYFMEVPQSASLVVSAGADKPERFLTPAGAGLRVAVRPEGGEAQTAFKVASSPAGEVITLEMDLGSFAGRRVEISFGAEQHDLFLRPLLYASSGNAGRTARGGPKAVPERLNLLMIVLDGASAGRMSAYGYTKRTTPEIEKLAERGVVFDNAISQAVYTIASIGSVLTGQYPDRHQSVSFADRLPSSAVTLPGLLSPAGFRTAGFSGNAVVSTAFGLDQGYDEFYAVWQSPDYTGHGDSVLRSFLSWLEAHHTEQFFAYIHFREPHFPYNPPPPYDTLFAPARVFPEGIKDWQEVEAINRAAAAGDGVPADVLERVRGLYDGNMAYVDVLVGEILKRVEALGLDRKTAVILFADHGEALLEHRYIGHNTQLYEESIRVPLLVSLPGLAPRRVSDVVELTDLAPTVLDLAGLSDRAEQEAMQGRSLVPLLYGEEIPEKLAFSRTLWNKPRYAARGSRFKFIWDSRNGSSELYDLEKDPGETVNRIDENPVTSGYLRQRLYQWVRQQEHLRVGAPMREEALISEDVRKHLEAIGYVEYLEETKK